MVAVEGTAAAVQAKENAEDKAAAAQMRADIAEACATDAERRCSEGLKVRELDDGVVRTTLQVQNAVEKVCRIW